MGLSLDDPFSVTKNFLQREKLGSTCNAIFIDMHGEATSEKMLLVIILMVKYQLFLELILMCQLQMQEF